MTECNCLNECECGDRIRELQEMTPFDAWEGFVGTQTVAEFLYYGKSKNPIDAVREYVQTINDMFNTKYNKAELDVIGEKLVAYIKKNGELKNE